MLQIGSEIGRLRKVLLHRPGRELENLIPEALERLLFDDIPWLEKAQEEHDAFAGTLRSLGVEVVYLQDLASQAIDTGGVKEEFIDQYIREESILKDERRKDQVKNYLLGLSTWEMVGRTMSGIQVAELPSLGRQSLRDYEDCYPLVCDPMPNLYFTRDPFASIMEGVSLNRMYSVTRQRETIFGEYIFKYHPDYRDVPSYYSRYNGYSLEGGDILVLNESTVAVGLSQRTESGGIESLAHALVEDPRNGVKKVLAFSIPKSRAFMHLDTVFTQVDYGKFTIHGGIQGPLMVYELTLDQEGKMGITLIEKELSDILSAYTGREVSLIPCAGGARIASRREQWNDGANTLAVAPGEAVVYSRNTLTNQILKGEGVGIHVIPSSELSRGRGGPRCMSMPLIRDAI